MNIANKILTSDLARLAREGGSGFVSDPRISPQTQADAAFGVHNGMSREAWAERAAIDRRDDWNAKAVADLTGEPPADVCDEKQIINGVTTTTKKKTMKGLPPKQVRHALYRGWLAAESLKLSSLEAKKIELEEIIAAPAKTEGTMAAGIRRTADFLLGRGGNGSDEAEAGAVAAKLAVARHRAEAAKVALQELDWEIDRAKIRLNFLDKREADFLNPCLVELADHLGAIYIAQIEKMRLTAGLLFGLSDLVRTFGNGFDGATEIKFPKMTGLPSIAGAKADAFIIGARGDTATWRQIVERLRRDPACKVDAPRPLP
jgi:hypothetical protein